MQRLEMPIFSRKKSNPDIAEIKDICDIIGITFSKNDFKKNSEKYTRVAEEYKTRVRAYLYQNRNRLLDLQSRFVQDESLPPAIALGKARLQLIAEIQQIIRNEQNKLEKNAKPTTEKHQPEQKKSDNNKANMHALIEEFSGYKDLLHGGALLEQKAAVLRKKANYVYLKRTLDTLDLHGQEAVNFRIRMARSNTSLKDFLQQYDISAPSVQEKTKQQSPALHKIAEKKHRQKISIKKRTLHWAHRKGFINRIRFWIAKKIKAIAQYKKNYQKQISNEKKARIIAFKQNIREQSRKKLKYAAIGIPFAAASYLGYKSVQNAGPAFDFSKLSSITDTISSRNVLTDKTTSYYAQATGFFDKLMGDKENLSWAPFFTPKEIPINEEDYDIQVPFIKNDKLHNVPNTDFFNLCFHKANEDYGKNGKYGITRNLYRQFKRDNSAMAMLYGIKSYDKLSFDDARIIAKTEIFDKYGIAYIQNRSIATYLYYALVRHQNTGDVSIATIANTVSDFYELNGKTMPENQQKALEAIGNSGLVSNIDNWHRMIAAINATAVNADMESSLFAALQQNVLDANFSPVLSQQKDVNSNFTYEPTLNLSYDLSNQNSFADSPFLPEVVAEIHNTEAKSDLLHTQKQKELETFSKIYAQCNYSNVVKLSYGEKSEAFAEANRSLAHYGIRAKINRRLYCAGMSMASLCQAYEIFQKQNPDSPVGDAIKTIIDKCRTNAHSSTGMRNIFRKYSGHVIYSKNLEQDIKNYMKKNPYAIIQGGFQRNANGNQHYNGFFPTMNASSSDAYTYCTYNSNHWGNEKTFSSVLQDRRRSRFGKSGWFIDITAWINDEAEKNIAKNLETSSDEKDTLSAIGSQVQQYYESVTTLLNQKFAGRN